MFFEYDSSKSTFNIDQVKFEKESDDIIITVDHSAKSAVEEEPQSIIKTGNDEASTQKTIPSEGDQAEVSNYDKCFILMTKDVEAFEATLIQTKPGDTVHNVPLESGFNKYLIKSVLSTSWEGFNSDIHSKGSYVAWEGKFSQEKPSFSTTNFYQDHGDGMMDGKAKTVAELGLKSGRKRKRNPEEWKLSKDKKRKIEDKRILGPACECRMKCSSKVDDATRTSIMNEYCDLKDAVLQWAFHTNNVRNELKDRQRVRGENVNSRRQISRWYHLRGVEVCKKMYLQTIGVSETVVGTALKKRIGKTMPTVDLSGGNRPQLVNERARIIQHIKMFPVKDTHYCRKDTQRRYLHEKLSIAKMHALYVKWCEAQNYNPQKIYLYAEVFNKEFNLSFFRRKKDKCTTCIAFENSKLSQARKKLVFRERDVMKSMEIADLTHYNVRKVAIDQDKSGQPDTKIVELEKEAMQKAIQVKIDDWLSSKASDSIENVKDGSIIEDDSRESDDEDDSAITVELNENQLFENWRMHNFNVELSRKLVEEAKEIGKAKLCSYRAFDLQRYLIRHFPMQVICFI